MSNKEIREISEDGKIVQITTWDERWYVETEKNDDGRIMRMLTYPSVTWISSHYPKSVALIQWIAKQGLDESEAIKSAAGDRGHRVHQAITRLLQGETIGIDSSLDNASGGQHVIKLEEYEALMSFVHWYTTVKPKIILNEQVVFNYEYEYAGTVDLVCEINGVKWLIDFKTSQSIWPSYEVQVAAYKHTLAMEQLGVEKIGILQIGYKRNKNGYKFTALEDQFRLFLATKAIWAKEVGMVKVYQKDFPTALVLPTSTADRVEEGPIDPELTKPKEKVKSLK